MGIDTNVLLRVGDHAALGEALVAHARADRQIWTDHDRGPEYDELREDGHDPTPPVRQLADGNVSIFTGHRFHDADAAFTLRSWLWAHFGSAFPRIHDDPRGVFAFPDSCAPHADTYEGILEELASVGRFVDPSPPTDAERATREREIAELIEGVRQRHTGALPAVVSEPPLEGFAAVLSKLVGRDLSADLNAVLGRATAGAAADPLGVGRVAVLVPPVVAGLVSTGCRLDVDERIDLQDGSAILVTTRFGDDDMPAVDLAETLAAAGLDREHIGPLPFFRESLVEAVEGEATFEGARLILGDRARPIALRTMEERMRDDRDSVAPGWLQKTD